MHRFRLALVAGAALAATIAIGAGASSAIGSAHKAKAGGTITFAAEQIPPCLNGYLSGCNNTWTSWSAGIAFRGLYIVKPNFSIVPDLAAGPAQLISKKPETLLVKISPKAVWSDGKPITVDDYLFAYSEAIKEENDFVGLDDLDRIESYTSPSAGTIVVTLKDTLAKDLAIGAANGIGPVPKLPPRGVDRER